MPPRRDNSIAIDAFVSHYQSERPVDWAGRFGRAAAVEVEIGFGYGDFLVRKAQREPDRDFVGIELDWARVKKTLGKMAAIRRSSSSVPALSNIRVMQVEARVAFERLFRPKTIDRVYCLFPCPWPKKGHIKYRLFSRPFTELVNSRLKDRGEIQIVTDFRPYFDWLKDEVAGTGFAVQEAVVAPQFDTKYERKWCQEGQEEFYELRLTKEQHREIILEEDVALKVHFIDQFNPDHFGLEEIKGDVAVIQKEFIFDQRREKGLVHVVVSEPSLTQHLWAVIARARQGWCVAKAEGHTAVPTPGVALALKAIADAAVASGSK